MKGTNKIYFSNWANNEHDHPHASARPKATHHDTQYLLVLFSFSVCFLYCRVCAPLALFNAQSGAGRPRAPRPRGTIRLSARSVPPLFRTPLGTITRWVIKLHSYHKPLTWWAIQSIGLIRSTYDSFLFYVYNSFLAP